MASRRELKKSIKFISVELITECYINYMLHPNTSKDEINSIVSEINKLNYELISRINHTDGKNNKKVTKTFYTKVIEDWNKGVSKIATRIEKMEK